MKWHSYLRLLAVPLLTVLLLARVPLVEAAALGWPDDYFRVKHKKDDDKDKRKATVPEGSGGAALVLAAAALGGGLLVSRRK